MHRRLALAAVLSIVSLLGSAPAVAQTTLRWQFQPGQEFLQQITQEMVLTGGAQKLETVQTIDAVWKVGAVDPQGTAEVSQEIQRIRMKMVRPDGTSEYDTASDQAPQGLLAIMAPALKAMTKVKFTMKMNSQGEVLEADVSQSTLDAMKAIAGAGQAGATFSKEQLVAMIKKGTPPLPKDPVNKGDTWSRAMELELPGGMGNMASEMKLTYGGPEQVEGKTLERIDMDVTANVKPVGTGAPLAATLKVDKSRGTIYFDNAAGRLSHSETAQELTMQLSMGGRSMTQTIQQNIKVQMAPAKK